MRPGEVTGVDSFTGSGMVWSFGSQFVFKFSVEKGTVRFSQTLQPEQGVDF